MRVDQLTFLRFIAAISIVIFHYGREVFPFNIDAITTILDQAYFGVSFFFILSGFVMIIAYGKRGKKINTIDYYKNRFARIYPVYFLGLMLVVIYWIVNDLRLVFLPFGLNLFLLQSWIPPYPLSFNGPGWSLSVEFFFYLLFPFLFNFIYSKTAPGRLVIPVLFIWLATQIVFNLLLKSSFFKGFPSNSHDLLFYFPVIHLNEFLVGNLAGLYFLGMGKEWYKNYDWALLVLTAGLFVLLNAELDINYHDGLLAIVFIPIILLCSLNTGKITRLFNLKIFVFLGEISYGIYILQKPIYEFTIIISKAIGFNNSQGIFYSYLVVLVIISGLSYVYFEAPVRQWIKSAISLSRLGFR